MKYIEKKIGKWMPPDSKNVAVDSRPRLSGIMDTINATLAHGPDTRLPKEFYDQGLRDRIDHIAKEEWFQGYNESREYRMLGIGGLLGDVVARMAGSAENNNKYGILEVGGEGKNLGTGRGGEQKIKLALSGCHDTTLGAVLASLGCFDQESWPFFTSHIAFELFKSKAPEARLGNALTSSVGIPSGQTSKGWWSRFFGPSNSQADSDTGEIGRKPLEELSASERASLNDYYVRIRYNDKIMTVPGCKPDGKHLEGDESLCTMVGLSLLLSSCF
jgi:acid phosphatase